MDVTYAQLKDAHKNRLESERGAVSDQLLRNHSSTLNTFLLHIGKTLESKVGTELLQGFEEAAAKFVSTTSPTNKKTAADKLSILRAWRATAESFTKKRKLRNAALASGVATPFQLELHVAIEKSGKQKKGLAREAAINNCTLHRWLNGTPPNDKTSVPAIHRLENSLGLERGYLEKLMPPPNRLPTPIARKEDAFSRRHSVNSRDRYFLLREHISEPLKNEWFEFIRYKTIESPIGLERSPLGRWQTLPPELCKPHLVKDPWIQPVPNEICATASRVFSSIRGFLGFLSRIPSPDGDIARGGVGLPLAEVQTLALFVIPEFVQGFLQYMKARAGNIAHTGHGVLAGFISTLVHPEYGYLLQQPERYKLIEKYAKDRSWDALCAEVMSICEKWQLASAGNKSRNPETPINLLLRLDAPLEPLFRAISDLDKTADKKAEGGVRKAKLKRNAMILALAIANPLRERTLTVTKYVAPGTDSEYESNLYKTDSGEWHLAFSKEHFKNRSSKKEDYDAPLPGWITKRLEEYLTKYRPLLIQKCHDCPWLFPSSQDGKMLSDLSGIINRTAQLYIPEVKRIRAHAVRHIVATDFLAKNPGQFDVVSQLLHDNFETVYQTYAHKKKDSAFKAYDEHMNRHYMK